MKRLITTLLSIGLLTACAGISAPGASKTETPKQALTAAGKAMAQLNSAKFDVNGTLNVTLPQPLADQLKAMGGSQAAVLSSNMTVSFKITGAAQKPDRLQANLSATLGGLTIETEVIAMGGNLYYKDPTSGKWQMAKRAPETTSPTAKASAPKLSYQAVVDTAKSVTEITDSSSAINGAEHYRIVPDLARLFAQVTAGHTSSSSATMTALQTVLQNASLKADAWTGTGDHLVRRLSYDADVSADLHQLAAALGNSATAMVPALNLPAGSIARVTAHAVIDLHDFNSKLTIKAPAVTS